MKPHVEAWALYCATHKYSMRKTITQAMAQSKAVLTVISGGVKCEVCGGWLQVGYKVLLPDKDVARVYTIGYIHTKPEWCERATEAVRVKQECAQLLSEAQALMRPQGEWEARLAQTKQAAEDAFKSVDQEQHAGAVFDNPLLAVSARIALAWMDLEGCDCLAALEGVANE
jgi:hypothetical protein